MSAESGNEAAISAGLAVLDAHFAGLNARDEAVISATLHFPHYRLSLGRVQVWETPDQYFADFLARAGDGWDHSEWDFRNVVAAGSDKVHFDVQFTRYRDDGSAMGHFRSLWVIARLDGRWAAQLRSSFAS